MVIHFGFLVKIVDVEATFLYREVKEEIFMVCPQGMDNVKKDDFILNNLIYGLVQAARQYYKKAIEILKK